jgi:hypothetical protein
MKRFSFEDLESNERKSAYEGIINSFQFVIPVNIVTTKSRIYLEKILLSFFLTISAGF